MTTSVLVEVNKLHVFQKTSGCQAEVVSLSEARKVRESHDISQTRQCQAISVTHISLILVHLQILKTYYWIECSCLFSTKLIFILYLCKSSDISFRSIEVNTQKKNNNMNSAIDI